MFTHEFLLNVCLFFVCYCDGINLLKDVSFSSSVIKPKTNLITILHNQMYSIFTSAMETKFAGKRSIGNVNQTPAKSARQGNLRHPRVTNLYLVH